MSYRIVDEHEGDYRCLENIKCLEFGAGCNYYVLNNEKPYLRLIIDSSSFNDAVVFYEYLYIGNYTNGIYVVNLKDYSIRKIEVDGYFGYFHINNDVLYILGCNNITAVVLFSNIIWKSKDIAVDGIVFQNIKDDVMYVECEMDPPDGWINRQINITTGKIVK